MSPVKTQLMTRDNVKGKGHETSLKCAISENFKFLTLYCLSTYFIPKNTTKNDHYALVIMSASQVSNKYLLHVDVAFKSMR